MTLYEEILSEFENGNTKLLDEFILKNYSNDFFRNLCDLLKKYKGDFSIVDYIIQNQYFCEKMKISIKENALDLGLLPDYCSYGIMYFIMCSFCETYGYEMIEREYDGVHGMNVDGYKEYMRSVKKYPVLPNKENNNLALQAHNGDLNAREKLINCNQRLVISLALPYFLKFGNIFELMDLIQFGNIGLMKAIKKYQIEQGSFSTYAYHWIGQSISRNIQNYSKVIRIPINVQEDVVKLRKHEELYFEKFGKIPTTEEMAEFLFVDEERIKELKSCQRDIVSLDKELTDDGDTTLKEMIVDEDNNPSQIIESKLTKEDIERNFSVLTEREAYIIKARFGFLDGNVYTLQEVGKQLNLTRERVRQIEIKALKKLKNKLKRGYGDDFKTSTATNKEKEIYLVDLFEGEYTLDEIKSVFGKLQYTHRSIIKKMYGHNLDEKYLDLFLEGKDTRLLKSAIVKLKKLLDENISNSYPEYETELVEQAIYIDDEEKLTTKKELVIK